MNSGFWESPAQSTLLHRLRERTSSLLYVLRADLLNQMDTVINTQELALIYSLMKQVKSIFHSLLGSFAITLADIVILASPDPPRGTYFTLQSLSILTSENCS